MNTNLETSAESKVIIMPMTMGDYDEVIALWKATPGIGLSDADS